MISVYQIMNATEPSKAVRLPFFDTPCILPDKMEQQCGCLVARGDEVSGWDV